MEWISDDVKISQLSRDLFDPDPNVTKILQSLSNESMTSHIVKIGKEDMEFSLHIFYNEAVSPSQIEVGGNLNLEDGKTTLSSYSRRIWKSDFQWEPTAEQLRSCTPIDQRYFQLYKEDLQKERKLHKDFDFNLARKYYWIIVGCSKDGPFMLLDGNHRAQVTYMRVFLDRNIAFESIVALCVISNNFGSHYSQLVSRLRS